MMRRSFTRAAGALALATATATCTGTALAGNGNGNSTNAPGQQKQATRAATSTPGVKPSNSTQHDTACSMGGTGSSPTCTPGSKPDSSKQYGNGKTAAQIAASRGAPAGTKITGPGNSQPHKVVTCKHPHGVDVHAVKSYSSQDCAQAKVESQAAAQVQPTTSGQVAAAAMPAVQQFPAAQALAPQAQGGVLGATASLATPKAHVRGGVLGTVGSIAGSTLPFTGFPVWLALLVALALVAVGVTLRRGGSSPTRL